MWKYLFDYFGAKSPIKAIHPALEKQNITKKQLAETGISKW